MGLPRIVMDARMLGGTVGGVATYTANLYAALRAAGLAPIILADAGGERESRFDRWHRALSLRTRKLVSMADSDRLVGHTGLFREAQVFFNLHGLPMTLETELPPGIMHWTYPVPLALRGWHNLYTVHDTIPLTHPALTGINPRRHRLLLKSLLDAGGSFLTVSETSRDEIAAKFGLEREAVFACWQGVQVTSVPPRPAASGDYFIFCGKIEARKNIAALVTAHGRSGSSLPLLLVGDPPQGDAAIMKALAANPRAKILPPQARGELDRLIANARALLFPSLAEGFGLPVIEAMMLGTAVLTSNQGALAEIAGDAAVLVDPENVAAMSEAIVRLEKDDALIQECHRAGLVRATAFDIANYGFRLATVYEQLIAAR